MPRSNDDARPVHPDDTMYTLPSPLALRHASAADAAFCRALYASTRDDLRRLPLPPALLDDLVAMQQRLQEEGQRTHFPDAEILILEHGGVPAGRAVVDTSGRTWRLVDLALLPAMRGRGLAGAVLAALQQRAAASNAGIGLAVMRSNALALHVYERGGFRIVASDALQHEMAWVPD
jgi:GNAT superfamily N-acetyltransferase